MGLICPLLSLVVHVDECVAFIAQVSEDDGDTYVNSKGMVYCSAHRRELCHLYCMDHRPTNELRRAELKGKEPDIEAILETHGRINEAEVKAIKTKWHSEGRQGPLVYGGP